MAGIDVTRRGFLAGLAGSYVSAATGGLSAGLEAVVKTAAPLLPIPTADEVTSAYNWLADHVYESDMNGGGFFPSAMLNSIKTISRHLDHTGAENPFREKVKLAERLCEIDPEQWSSGMSRPNYNWSSNSEESRIARLLTKSVDDVSRVLNMPAPAQKFMLDRQAAYERSMAARQAAEAARQEALESMEENSVESLETTAEQPVASLTAPEERASFSMIQNAFTNTVNAITAPEPQAKQAVLSDLNEDLPAQEEPTPKTLPAPQAFKL